MQSRWGFGLQHMDFTGQNIQPVRGRTELPPFPPQLRGAELLTWVTESEPTQSLRARLPLPSEAGEEQGPAVPLQSEWGLGATGAGKIRSQS